MAEKHPYISGGGALVRAVNHFRRSLPTTIDADILKKLGLAPKNESYLINTLKFVGIIGEDGAPTPEAREVFVQHDDTAFQHKLAQMIEKAYADLFSLHGEGTWELDHSALVTYFRHNDQTSAIVGSRQASTFQILASIAGHGDLTEARTSAGRKGKEPPNRVETKSPKRAAAAPSDLNRRAGNGNIGLTVRIEINLPAAGDQATYDRIFKSIRDNLLNA